MISARQRTVRKNAEKWLYRSPVIVIDRYLQAGPLVYFVVTEGPIQYRLKPSRIIYIGQGEKGRLYEAANQTIGKYENLREARKYKKWGNKVEGFVLQIPEGGNAKIVERACLGLFRNDHGELPIFNQMEKWKPTESFEKDIEIAPFTEWSLKKLIRSFEKKKTTVSISSEIPNSSIKNERIRKE